MKIEDTDTYVHYYTKEQVRVISSQIKIRELELGTSFVRGVLYESLTSDDHSMSVRGLGNFCYNYRTPDGERIEP